MVGEEGMGGGYGILPPLEWEMDAPLAVVVLMEWSASMVGGGGWLWCLVVGGVRLGGDALAAKEDANLRSINIPYSVVKCQSQWPQASDYK